MAIGSLWWTLVVWVTAIAIFHVVLIYWKPQPKTFWLKAEYLVLGVVVFSLIAATAAIRQVLAESEANSKQIWLDFNRADLSTFVHKQTEVFAQHKQENCHDWFAHAQEALAIDQKVPLGSEAEAWSSFYNLHNADSYRKAWQSGSAWCNDTRGVLLWRLKGYLDMLHGWNTALADAKPNEWDFLIMVS
jgi:phosphoglycerol transferase MdoB-like AlkP superfamily enzyme